MALVNGKQGGLLKGKSHSEGGIEAIVDGSKKIEVEGGEVIINKKSSKLFCKELSKINQAGGGVAIPCEGSNDTDKFMYGGSIDFFGQSFSDSGYKFKRDINNIFEQVIKTKSVKLLLQDLIEHKQLFDIFPKIGEVNVYFQPMKDPSKSFADAETTHYYTNINDYKESYYKAEITIKINIQYYEKHRKQEFDIESKNPEYSIEASLLHEIQHVSQQGSGRNFGYSYEEAIRQTSNGENGAYENNEQFDYLVDKSYKSQPSEQEAMFTVFKWLKEIDLRYGNTEFFIWENLQYKYFEQGGKVSKKWYRKYNGNNPYSQSDNLGKYGNGIYFSDHSDSRFEGENEIEVEVNYNNPKIFDGASIPNLEYHREREKSGLSKSEFTDSIFKKHDAIILKHGNKWGNELIVRDSSIVNKSDNVELFYKWYTNWYKGIHDKMNIVFSMPHYNAQLNEPNNIILDVFEKIDQNIDAKTYLKTICEKADEYGVNIYLMPNPRHKYFLDNDAKRKKINKEYLIKYYKEFGFSNLEGGFMKRLARFENGGKIDKSESIKDRDFHKCLLSFVNDIDTISEVKDSYIDSENNNYVIELELPVSITIYQIKEIKDRLTLCEKYFGEYRLKNNFIIIKLVEEFKTGGKVEGEQIYDHMIYEEGGVVEPTDVDVKNFIDGLTIEQKDSMISAVNKAKNDYIIDIQTKLDLKQAEKESVELQKKSEQDISKRTDLHLSIIKNEQDIRYYKNLLTSWKNGNGSVSFTDRRGVEHPSIPHFTNIKTDSIIFDEETILVSDIPPYIPYIDEYSFRIQGYVFDAIRVAENEYILATNGYKEKQDNKGYHWAKENITPKHPDDIEQGYVLVTLDQLVLINDYYYTKARAINQKEADESNKRQEDYYDRLPFERREKFLNQKNFYASLPVAVKKKITQEEYETLSVEEKEKLYKPFKRTGAKRIVSKLGENQMWSSFHMMYERFLNPEALPRKKDGTPVPIEGKRGGLYGHKEVFDYWYAFVEMMKWKLNDIKVQREIESETRKIALETSFGESNTNTELKENYGILVKRQNGTPIKPVEIALIEDSWVNVQTVFGGLHHLATEDNLKISHTGEKHVFASKAVGMYLPKMRTIAVSNKYGKEMFNSIMAHEVAHYIDNKIGEQTGQRFSTDNYESTGGIIASTFRKSMNAKSNSDYINATKECFARAMEQHFSVQLFGEGATIGNEGTYFSSNAYVSKSVYEESIKPLIEKFIEEHKEFLKYAVATEKDKGTIKTEENKTEGDIESTAKELEGMANSGKSINIPFKGKFADGKEYQVNLSKPQTYKDFSGTERKGFKGLANSTVPYEIVSEAYHKAKADGTNSELVKAVEYALFKQESGEQPKTADWLNTKDDIIQIMKDREGNVQPQSWYERMAKEIIGSHITATMNNYLMAIQNGNLTKEKAIEIIESAGLTVPNEILEYGKQILHQRENGGNKELPSQKETTDNDRASTGTTETEQQIECIDVRIIHPNKFSAVKKLREKFKNEFKTGTKFHIKSIGIDVFIGSRTAGKMTNDCGLHKANSLLWLDKLIESAIFDRDDIVDKDKEEYVESCFWVKNCIYFTDEKTTWDFYSLIHKYIQHGKIQYVYCGALKIRKD